MMPSGSICSKSKPRVVGAMLCGCQPRSVLFLKRFFRNSAFNQALSRIFQNAGGFASLGIADDQATRGIFGLTGDAGKFERQTVSQCHVPIEAIDENRV